MAVTGLRITDVTWSMSDHDELLATGEDVILEAIDELGLGPAAVLKVPRFVCTHR